MVAIAVIARYDAYMDATIRDQSNGNRMSTPSMCGMAPGRCALMATTMTTMITTARTGITRPAVVVFRG